MCATDLAEAAGDELDQAAANELPVDWDDVPAMGEMIGRGMMRGDVEATAWRLAHVCNSCHVRFRKNPETEGGE